MRYPIHSDTLYEYERITNTGLNISHTQDALPEILQQEIKVMKLLAHKNLVRLVEIINDSESPNLYLVLEHVEGGPIMKHDPRTNKFVYTLTGFVMGESTARRAFHDLLSGLSFMHANHIAHR
jgi:calcium/calmodulin-dependent protein kinase kinase 1